MTWIKWRHQRYPKTPGDRDSWIIVTCYNNAAQDYVQVVRGSQYYGRNNSNAWVQALWLQYLVKEKVHNGPDTDPYNLLASNDTAYIASYFNINMRKDWD